MFSYFPSSQHRGWPIDTCPCKMNADGLSDRNTCCTPLRWSPEWLQKWSCHSCFWTLAKWRLDWEAIWASSFAFSILEFCPPESWGQKAFHEGPGWAILHCSYSNCHILLFPGARTPQHLLLLSLLGVLWKCSHPKMCLFSVPFCTGNEVGREE